MDEPQVVLPDETTPIGWRLENQPDGSARVLFSTDPAILASDPTTKAD